MKISVVVDLPNVRAGFGHKISKEGSSILLSLASDLADDMGVSRSTFLTRTIQQLGDPSLWQRWREWHEAGRGADNVRLDDIEDLRNELGHDLILAFALQAKTQQPDYPGRVRDYVDAADCIIIFTSVAPKIHYVIRMTEMEAANI